VRFRDCKGGEDSRQSEPRLTPRNFRRLFRKFTILPRTLEAGVTLWKQLTAGMCLSWKSVAVQPHQERLASYCCAQPAKAGKLRLTGQTLPEQAASEKCLDISTSADFSKAIGDILVNAEGRGGCCIMHKSFLTTEYPQIAIQDLIEQPRRRLRV
jgi:hypothetical protein